MQYDSDNSRCGLCPGDELEVFYPELLGVPHRGLVYGLMLKSSGTTEIHVIHNTKERGVQVTDWAAFARGRNVVIRRRPTAAGHSRVILQRATLALGQPYSLILGNCEHFSDFCYNGVHGESSTLQAGALVGISIVGLLALADQATKTGQE